MPRTPKSTAIAQTNASPKKPQSANAPILALVILTGISGSGKSVALHALEDAGYYCIDNLPPELLGSLIALEEQRLTPRLAVAIDIRSAQSLSTLPAQLQTLNQRAGLELKTIFLDASADTLLRRFSETRRMHPLTMRQAQKKNPLQKTFEEGQPTPASPLAEAIEQEREALAPLRELAHVIDTSFLRAQQLRSHIKNFVHVPEAQLTLVFESFAFKRGIPLDADYVIDVRMLPNPHYEEGLQSLTGKDQAVVHFLAAQPQVMVMKKNIIAFLETWLPVLAQNQRSYVTVAIGCTGGQHRSVYLVEELWRYFTQTHIETTSHTQTVLARHRELG
jgi:UPF0042 nucleotide-binding protein